MPELPEVQTMVNGIRAAVTGHRIAEMRFCPSRYRPLQLSPTPPDFCRSVAGKTVTEVDRLGKRVLLMLDSSDAVVIEPRMTGLLLLADPPNVEHLRIEWRLERRRSASSLWFWDRRGLGTVRLLSETGLAVLRDEVLGPDALAMSPAIWKARLARTSRAIKVALLDQALVAGIGNLYASEILHRARIHPESRADSLQKPQIERLANSTQEILETAILYEGSTLGDGTYRNALNRDGRYQNEHRVYMKAGQRCVQCGRGEIRRVVQAQRSTFYCPVCQRRPRT